MAAASSLGDCVSVATRSSTCWFHNGFVVDQVGRWTERYKSDDLKVHHESAKYMAKTVLLSALAVSLILVLWRGIRSMQEPKGTSPVVYATRRSAAYVRL